MILERRSALADAVLKSLDVFNTHIETSFENVMERALTIIAEALQVETMTIYRCTGAGDGTRLKRLYRWTYIKNGAADKDTDSISPTVDAWDELLTQNIHVNKCKSIAAEDELKFLDAHGIQAVFVSPIFTTGHYWGCVVFQDHRYNRLFDEDCADIIGSAARMIAGAIIRKEMTNDLEESFLRLKQSKEMTDTLNKTATLFLTHRDMDFTDMMEEGIIPVVNMLHIDILSIWRHVDEPDNLHMSQIYRWDRDGASAPFIDFSNYRYAEYAPTWSTLFTYNDAVNGPVSKITDPVTADILKPFGGSSVFATPVFLSEVFWGFVLFIDTHNERYFNEENAEMMRVAALLFANAVTHEENEKAFADEKERGRLMLDTSPLCAQLWDGEFNVIDCNEAAVKLFELKSKQEFMTRFFEFSPSHQPDGQQSWYKAVACIQKALREGGCTFNWAYQFPNGSPLPAEVILKRVYYKGSPIVVGYTRDLREIIHMENKIMQLEAEAGKIFYDALTGLYNRRFVDEHLNRLLKSLSRMEGMLSIMMVDIDHFKKFNDTYGHNAGDACLKEVARLLAAGVAREDDFVARYGGEEFLVVLPNTSEKSAVSIAEKMLATVRGLAIEVGSGKTASAAISIGLVSGFAQPNLSAVDYIDMADKQLYASKQNGRDRYTFKRF
jgi:diguanylate cyclase (GGDEF)-like protein